MQGCAAVETKLRQCMDQPVRIAKTLDIRRALTPRSAIRARRRTTSTTTCRGCTPRWSVHTSGNRLVLSCGSSNLVLYMYAHQGEADTAPARGDFHQRAQRDIGTAFRRVEMVVYTQCKSRNRSPLIFCASRIHAFAAPSEAEILLPSIVMTRVLDFQPNVAPIAMPSCATD